MLFGIETDKRNFTPMPELKKIRNLLNRL